MSIDLNQVSDVEIDGIDFADAPDFCDAFIISASIDGREATDAELDQINAERDFVYDCVLRRFY